MASDNPRASASHLAVRGTSLRDAYAQQKANDELQNLLDSEAPGAPAKAFVQGFVGGAAVPMLMTALPWAMRSGAVAVNAERQLHMVALLQSNGMPEREAREAAASAVQYLTDTSPMGENTRKALRNSMSEFVVGESRYSSAERALKGTREWAKSRGIDVSDDTIVGNIKRVAPDKLPGGAKLSPLQSQSVFREAERAFKAMGKEAPKNPGAVLKHFSATMRRAAPFIAIPAVSVGIASAFNVRRKRKALAHLRKTAEDQSMLDRAQQAAPGLATLPGFALGAADTQTFDPRNLIGERAGRALGAPKGLKSRIVSGLVGAGALSTAAALPGMLRDSAHAVGGSKPAAAATAPIIIQKKAAALPHMLDELDKIARRTEQLDLKPRAWDLGIHAKKTDQDHRGIAYTHGVGGVAAAGAVGAGTQGAVLGRSLLAMRHASARRQALEEAVTDAAQLVKANLQARANFATSAGRTALDQAKAGVGMGDAAASSVESGLRGAANSVDTSKLTEIARRRGKAGLKAGLGGAALFGGAKLLSNAAKYHTSKSLTTAPNERNS